MSIWGKIIGGFAGFAVGGPMGALIGGLAGHAVDKIRGAQEEPEQLEGPEETAGPTGAKKVAFTVAVIVLGAKMAKADGAVSRAEIKAFREVFHIPPEEVKNVGRIFDMAKKDAAGFEPYAKQVAWMFRQEPAVLEELLAGLFHIARADGDIHPAELDYLRKVGEIFGLGTRDFERVRATFMGPDKSDPYEVLGVRRKDSSEDIKKAYRKLIRENHPDTLVAQGMPEEFVKVANERMAAINAAYDEVEKQRGIK
jgi:DnaJ like chaperone protein